MTTGGATERGPRVICLEGPSAVGKTTLLAALARERGAAVVPELSAGPPPPLAHVERWFADQHAALWRQAVEKGAGAPFAVLDGDPFKGLWYNWIFAEEGWRGVDAVAPIYRAHLERGTLAFPDLYVVLVATEAQLRRRREGDPTRRRRAFEKHLRMLEPQRRYFAALQKADPPRVVFLDTADQASLVDRVTEAMRGLPSDPPDSMRLLDSIERWLRAHPDASAVDGIG